MGKKNKSISLEEKMENSLVPDWEQPYKVPDNWIWTLIAAGFEVTSSKRVHQSDWLTTGVPFYRTRELVKLSEYGYVNNELFISEELYEKCKIQYGIPQINDILISGVGTIGVPFVIKNTEKIYFKDGNVIWLKNRGLFNANYIFYLYKSLFIINQISDMSAGSTVDTYTISNAYKTKLPLPPLAEQQRIVDRIESLFSKLDEGKEKAQTALDSFENRKAAILHKAFIGELTRKWREENGVGVETRILKPLSAVCSSFQYGTSSKSVNDGSIAVIRMGNLQNGEIDWSDLVFSNNEEDNNKYELKDGDVLFNRTNSPALVGKTSIYRGDFPAIFAGYLIRLNYGDELIGDYLNYMMNTHQAKEYCNSVKSDGVNQSNINAKKIAAFIIPVPSIAEQTEIVRILDNIFKKEKQAKELASVIEKIDLMKKAILARAFRGELGTNNPEEESALNLLKEIMSKENKIEQKPNKKQISIPKSISKQFKTDLEEQIYRVILENQNSTLNQILSCISSSKHLDAMEVITILSDKGLIDKKDDLYFTK